MSLYSEKESFVKESNDRSEPQTMHRVSSKDLPNSFSENHSVGDLAAMPEYESVASRKPEDERAISVRCKDEVNVQTTLPISIFPISIALEQVFEFEDKAETHIEAEDYDKAFTIMKKKVDFGQQLIYARELIRFYKSAMLSKHSEKAAKIRDELIPIVKANTGATPDELEEYARKLEAKEKFFEAVLFYQLAAECYERTSMPAQPQAAAAGVTVCCEGIRNSSKALIKKRPDFKAVVQHHVIPLMHDMRHHVQSMHGIDPEFQCNCDVKCLHCIEYTEGRVGDHEGREQTLKEGIRLIERRLGTDCKKYGVYSLLLNNLACTYEVTHRLEEACKFYARAVKAHRSAEDYQSEEQRKGDIESSERGFKRSQEKVQQKKFAASMNQKGAAGQGGNGAQPPDERGSAAKTTGTLDRKHSSLANILRHKE